MPGDEEWGMTMNGFVSGATIAILTATTASAQDSSWTFNATVYGWLSGIDTAVETMAGTIETETSFEDILSKLDMVFMGTLEARRDRFGLVGDLIYLDLAGEQDTPLALFGDANVKVTSTILSGYALYRVTSDPATVVDLGAGFRSFDLDVELAVGSGILPGFSQSVGGNWVDPLIAARVQFPVSDSWTLTGFADWGGTGSGDETWQVFGSAIYAINEKWSTQFGYRYMDVSKELEGRQVDLGISGPVIAVALKF